MLRNSSLSDFLTYAQQAKRVAVYREIAADRLTPVGIVESLPEEMATGIILESGASHHSGGRHSFIVFDPVAEISVQNNEITQKIYNQRTTSNEDPLTVLRRLIPQFTCAGPADILSIMNSSIGFFTYDAVRLFESIPDQRPEEQNFPDLFFNFYQTSLAFDHVQQKLLIAVAVEIGCEPQKDYEQAQLKIEYLVKKITASNSTTNRSHPAQDQLTTETHVDIDDEDFINRVIQAKKYIEQGDAFQIVLSRRFRKNFSVSPFEIYRTLRRVSPAPYMFYINYKDQVILGASPEKLISVNQGEVTINPIAGTRPRAHLSLQQIEEELLNDKKERAEHTMLVDLARNDLGGVCKPGSVSVQQFLQVKHFSHVSHLTSTVNGLLQNNKDAFDAFAAAFPAGTLSGAPKIRAMEIIDELETSKRGLYGGAICRIDHQGNLDSCIAIRMAILKDNIATVRTGAGIVYDSNPMAEANETRQKAQGILEAIALAEIGG